MGRAMKRGNNRIESGVSNENLICIEMSAKDRFLRLVIINTDKEIVGRL